VPGILTRVSDPVNIPLDVVYDDAGDGWIMATVPQIPGAFSQGRTREQARANVLDALRELLLARGAEDPAPDALTLTIA